MARQKAKCCSCERTISLLITNFEDIKALEKLELGDLFEHKCPNCEEWAAFEILE